MDSIVTPPRTDDEASGRRSGVERWWLSRYGAPLLRELAIIVVLLVLYRLGRTIGRNETSRAFANARDILGLEDVLGIDNERSLQRIVLDHLTTVRFLNRYYASVHFPASIAFLAFVYLRLPRLVPHIRFLFVTVTSVALVIHLAFPLAPPRMLPGYVDTIAVYGPAIYEDSGTASLANQYAAMPSLHFGWAALVAYGLIVGLRTPWRWLAVLHPAITLVAIVLTANHFWLDAVVALALIAAAIAVAPRSARRPPPPALLTSTG